MPIKEVDWDKFSFRAHYFGELMSKPRGKTNLDLYNESVEEFNKRYSKLITMKEGAAMDNAVLGLEKVQKKRDELKLIKDIPVLSDTCKRRLAQIYTEETTGRRKDIMNVYIEKGLKTEEESITLYSLRTGIYYKKNKERIDNGYVNCEIDFDDEDNDMVIDTKSSFDIFTFDATVAKAIGGIYWWQLQCYIWAKNRKRGRLAYCLNNTPPEIVQKLKNSLKYNFIGSGEDFESACDEIDFLHTYDDLPLERKIRIYDVDRDDEKIELAKLYIPHFRNYLKTAFVNSKFENDENPE